MRTNDNNECNVNHYIPIPCIYTCIYNIITPNMYHVIIILYDHFSPFAAETEKVEPGPSPEDLNRRYLPYKRSSSEAYVRGYTPNSYGFIWLYMIQYLQFRYLKWSFKNTARMFKNKCLKIIRSHIFSVASTPPAAYFCVFSSCRHNMLPPRWYFWDSANGKNPGKNVNMSHQIRGPPLTMFLKHLKSVNKSSEKKTWWGSMKCHEDVNAVFSWNEHGW